MGAAGENPTSNHGDNAGWDLAFYRFALDSVPVGILTVDPQLRITSINPWARELTGYSEKEALRHYCGDILQGGMCKFHCPLKTAIDRRHPVTLMETTIRNRAGEIIPVRMHTAAMLDSSGGLIGAVEAFQDVSHLKALERERQNLVTMFAHDMKSSLSIIGGFVLRLLKRSPELDGQKQFKYLENIQSETGKLDFLVSDFLEFARLQTGRLKLSLQATSLDKELMEIFESYQSKAGQSGIELELRNEQILPVIKADPERLRRVFTNLLDNAFKFSTKGGTITISTQETARDIKVAISDQGAGIDPEDLPYVFDMFHQGKGASQTKGIGVGLAAVKAITEAHGGRVLVESSMSRGSTFTVVLPKHGRSLPEVKLAPGQ